MVDERKFLNQVVITLAINVFYCVWHKKNKLFITELEKPSEEVIFKYHFMAGEAGWQLDKNFVSNIEQVLAATPHKAPTIRPHASHHENQVRWTRHAGHSWRSRDELISDVLLWTPTYAEQKQEDPLKHTEDLPKAMNDREKWRERVRDIRASGTTWWWWWLVLTNFSLV